MHDGMPYDSIQGQGHGACKNLIAIPVKIAT